MARYKDFGAPFDAETAEKLTFKLYGEDFECYPEMQGKTLLEFVRNSSSDDITESISAITDFFSKVLVPESFEKFESLADDPNKIISISTLTEIVSWVMEQYADRPTQGSEHSSTGE
jgi:hypothetical protein